ncbi:Retrovirus-related Pol polyprotein, partial [Mucuna pruriens]
MQIHIAPEYQHKTTLTCPFGTFAYTRMSFGLCNALSTFQHCMTSIFSDLLQDCMEVFMDDFMVYATLSDGCLENLSRVLTRCIDTNLVLNFEKCHFMADKSKIDIITSLPNPTFVWEELKTWLTSTPILQAPNWEYPFELMCDVSNSTLKVILGQRVRAEKQSHVIAYASRTMDSTQLNYTTIEKELLAILFCLGQILFISIRLQDYHLL